MILLAGANGKLGRELLKILGPEKVVAATRRDTPQLAGFEQLSVANRSAIAAVPWHRFETVINVAGRVAGNADELHEANIAFAKALADAARAGGLSEFLQVSSFSVFGMAETIDHETPETPQTPYARSKAECDHMLKGMATDRFSTICVRLPFMFSENQPALLGQLLDILTYFPILPTDHHGTRRSMITYHDAAQVLINLIGFKESGLVCAASPDIFDAALLKRVLREEAGKKIWPVALPLFLAKQTVRLIPNLHRRLLQSNIHSDASNVACSFEGLHGIEGEIRKIIKNRFVDRPTDAQ